MCEGFVVREGIRVIDASSTVVYIRTSHGPIIVDTGSTSRIGMLRENLALCSLAPEAVKMVVNTHLHNDHIGGNSLFSGAVAMAHKLENPPFDTVRVADDHCISDGVTVLETPGHTLGSITVLVKGDRRYAVCGDAIPTKANYETSTPPAIHVNRRLAVESMNRILSWAEVVIPGHDAPFELSGKK
ncbi:MAG: MBL fold metallo-hydrolase [Methanobacteriota archaeon]|nr:MAG: MBL fold metallo-hydrolase [Euryarchaeota archaeon]